MPDDPTGRPKSTARRRRSSRSAASSSAPATPSTVERAPVEPDARLADADAVGSTEATDESLAEATDESPADEVIAESEATIWPLLDGRSPNAWVCPFLRSVDDRDRVDVPRETPDVANRCAALDEAVPQSLRQQELVCLTSSHVNCPRYLRGAVVGADVPPARAAGTPKITPAMLGALALLALAFTASVGFTFVRGGLDLPAAGVPGSAAPTSSAVAVVPTSATSAGPSSEVPAVPSVGPTPAEAASPVTTATPAPPPASTAAPTAAPTPPAVPSSDRYALLTACPATPDCWVYRVRTGDNLFSIANYFGVPLATVRALNPWTRTSGLKAGRELILPPPTR